MHADWEGSRKESVNDSPQYGVLVTSYSGAIHLVALPLRSSSVVATDGERGASQSPVFASVPVSARLAQSVSCRGQSVWRLNNKFVLRSNYVLVGFFGSLTDKVNFG